MSANQAGVSPPARSLRASCVPNFEHSANNPSRMSKLWTEADDQRLWTRQTERTSVLAADFGRSAGAIRARLEHLTDPEHRAYKRRVGGGSHELGRHSSSYETPPSKLFRPLPSLNNPMRNPYAPNPPDRDPSITMRNPYARSAARSTVLSVKQAEPSATEILTQSLAPIFGSPTASVTVVSEESVIVNAEQEAAANQIFQGQNTFLTGAAGTGKSFLLRHIIKGFEQRHPNGRGNKIAVTASTGIAATHIDGVTIHSWAGVGLGKGNTDALVEKVMKSRPAIGRWRAACVLIIDEVSMLDGSLFGSLDSVGRHARGRVDEAFGGLQLVLCGDFFQLPPVSLKYSKFAFQSSAWSSANIQKVELTRVARQANDSEFIDLLGQLRVGKCPASAAAVLSQCHISKKAPPSDGIVPTKLYCTNKNVDAENNARLAQLSGYVVPFPAKDVFKGYYSASVQTTLKDIASKKSPDVIDLKIGAQVILTRNMPERNLVNGSRGIVCTFQQDNQHDDRRYKLTYPLVLFANGSMLLVKPESTFHAGQGGSVVRIQLPLKLAWCLTVHKSQGMTLDRVELQLDDAFDYGQVYVALSRVTSLDGLWIRGNMLSQSIVKAHPDVISFYSKI